MKVLALAKYGSDAASTRQRILQYQGSFAAAGIALDCHPLLGNDYVRALSDGRKISRLRIAQAYVARMRGLLSGPRYDAYWVYADLFPYLPAAFDDLLFRQDRPVVIDWDDAFFENYARNASPLIRTLFRNKLDRLLSKADAITCGNRYLYDHADKFSIRRLVVPTVVDADAVRPGNSGPSNPPVIGWIGSPSTWPYVRPHLPLLRRLATDGRAQVLIVGAGQDARADEGAGLEFRDWSEERELADLQAMDIGIMPVPDRPWERGKSGYKLVQYMACGIPSVASPVGVNSEMLDGERVGLFAKSGDDWAKALDRLLSAPDLRSSMGKAARALAVEKYSLATQAPRLIDLFNSLAGR